MIHRDALLDPIEIAKNIFWIGMKLENDPFQCLPYLIKNGDESILVDPGSMLEFDEIVRKIKLLVSIHDIKYIILHHQDPDLAASVPELEKLIDRDDLRIITHSRMSLLIKHYMITSPYYEIDKEGYRLKCKSGLELEFYTTPYCHSPGAFVSYEPKTKTLFSGDIFGGIEHSWSFYADSSYFEKARLFHEEYMPSKDIFNYSLDKIAKLDIDLIAPQHGSIIKREFIADLIKDMKSLDCGLYIDKGYNEELLDTIKKLQKSQQKIKEQSAMLVEQTKRAELSEVMQNIAHQWRQPLSIISTSVGIVREKNRASTLAKEELEERFAKLEDKILYLSQTIEDFLDYYKPTKNIELFSIKEAIHKALSIIHIAEASIDIEAPEISYLGCQNDLVQVLVSLVSNINDIIGIREIKNPKVLIKLSENDKIISLSIEDNCGGIDEANLSKIFDPYFSTKHSSMGTGLGLHIAREIVTKSLGGMIKAINISNNSGTIIGAKFTIELDK